MQLNVTPSPQPIATLAEPTDLGGLRVVAPTGVPDDVVATAVAPWGRIDDDHAWLRIDRLREEVLAAGTDGIAFDGMIDYARGAGWVDADGRHVRAHVERTEG